MGTTALFIDGGYLDKVRAHSAPDLAVDYARLASSLAGSHELLRAYYYHGLP